MKNKLYNIEKSKNKEINIVIKLLISYYGKEYKKLILNRIRNTYFDFSYHKENKQLDMIKNILDEKLLNYILRVFSSFDIDLIYEKKEDFLKLFSNLYDKSYIDEIFIDKESNSKYIKKIIMCLEIFGIKKEEITPLNINKIIKYRDEIKLEYDIAIENSKFIRNISEDLLNKGVSIDTYSLVYLGSEENLGTEKYIENLRFNSKYGFNFINIPFSKLKEKKLSIDDTFIHELIHAIEQKSENSCGLHHNNSNRILNEIRVEMLAKRITNYLHSNNIYIFDDDNYSLESGYDKIIPFGEEFILKYEKLLNDIAIYEEDVNLENYFGKSFTTFSKFLDEEHTRIKNGYKNNNGYVSKKLDSEVFKEMDNFYNNRYNKRIRK